MYVFTRQKVHPANDFDVTGQCPDTVEGEAWDYGEGFVDINGRTIILDHSVDCTGESLTIRNGGRLIFKDMGPDATEPIKLRAKSIVIHSGGELWIGSRSCRYEGLADLVLYGNEEDMTFQHPNPGVKFLHVSSDGVLEMHGKVKHHWTNLDEHIFKDNVAAEQLLFKQNKWNSIDQRVINNRLVFHILSAEGDHKDAIDVLTGQSIAPVQAMVDALEDEEVSCSH